MIRNRFPRPTRPEMALALLAALTLSTLAYLGVKTAGTRDVIQAIARTDESIRADLVASHLWLEEAVAGDESIDENQDVFGALEKASRSCAALVDGGRTPVGVLPPADPGDFERDARELCSEIARLDVLAASRLDTGSASGSLADREFDQVFRSAMANSRSLQSQTRKRIDSLSSRDDALRILLMKVLLAMFVTVWVLIRRHERALTRRNAELAEANLHARSALERATRFEQLRERVVANVSHELRTPLVPIMGWSRLINQRSDLAPETVREYAGQINSSSKKLSQVIENLLSVAAHDQPEHPLRAEVRTKALFRAAADLVEESGRKVEIEIAEQASTIPTDRKRLLEALLQLVDNAIKFSPSESTICLSAEVQDDEVVLSVVDDGAGLPSHISSSVFELFVQGDGSSTREFGGTGAGLFLASRIANELQGRVEVKNEPGRGARSSIILPMGVGSART